ncbi:helix-turn-helix transcriptional regulator [Maricaulis sp.]|uniref:ArsR/SmtB family transcription factor n=1 Tax=Maricaulis sp. TaxID=1486257 RepID=UPI000C464FDD|nr:helix-turn-helix transcriptional regulator [Maricaulis sp.]MAC89249.1 transcriptional regulator [Maricaulis sp.]
MMSPDTMDAVFQALASATRREMLDIVRNEPGCSVGAVASRFDVSRIAVMRHLTVLEEAGLIISDKRGRTRHLYMNAVPIQMIHDRWTSEYSALWSGRMLDIKYLAEQRRARDGDAPEADEIAHTKGEPG